MPHETSAAPEPAARRQSVIDDAWNIVLAAARGAEDAARVNQTATFTLDDDVGSVLPAAVELGLG